MLEFIIGRGIADLFEQYLRQHGILYADLTLIHILFIVIGLTTTGLVE